MEDAPDEVAPDEDLGRAVTSSERTKDMERRRGQRYRAFFPNKPDISVDRLTVAGLKRAQEIAEARVAYENLTFYGWSVVPAEKAASNGRTVTASPTKVPVDNPFHADIGLHTDDRDERKSHAQALAAESHWLPTHKS